MPAEMLMWVNSEAVWWRFLFIGLDMFVGE
jgi:hypothetical protein